MDVVLIDDDTYLAAMPSDVLGGRLDRVWHVRTARKAEMVLDQALPDVLLLDRMVPDRRWAPTWRLRAPDCGSAPRT